MGLGQQLAVVERVLFCHHDFAGMQMDGHIDKLEKLARQFRAAIVEGDAEVLPVGLQDFPFGACQDAALLLAKYLGEQECGEFDYVLGQREGHTHAWLQQGLVMVDVTADQFEDYHGAVWVTVEHGWHSQFNGEVVGKADFEQYDAYTVATLRAAYAEIVGRLRT